MFEVLGVVHVVVDYLIIWGVDHIIVVGYIVDHYCFKCVWGVVHFVMVGYIVEHTCLVIAGGVIHAIVVDYLRLTDEWFALWLII